MTLINKIVDFFQNVGPVHILEFVVLICAFFFVLNVLRNNNSKLIILLFVGYVAVVCALTYMLDLPSYCALIFFALFVLAVVILFATEIKRAVWLTSMKGSDSKNWDSANLRENAQKSVDEIIKAVQNMSKNNVGAIIILADSNIPTAILDSGVALNSDISAALIESVFFPKTPLHDGAMIINGTKVQAAGCFLPASQQINLPKEFGSRHRAGIGITETVNVTAIIVSEETGVVSVARSGKLKRYADSDILRQTLHNFYWQDMLNE